MQEIEEASLPDLFGGREKRSPQYIKILPEKKARVIPRLCSNFHESLPAE